MCFGGLGYEGKQRNQYGRKSMPHTTLANLEICLRISSFVNVFFCWESNLPRHKLQHLHLAHFSPAFNLKRHLKPITSSSHMHILVYGSGSTHKASSSLFVCVCVCPVRGAQPKPASFEQNWWKQMTKGRQLENSPTNQQCNKAFKEKYHRRISMKVTIKLSSNQHHQNR